MGKKDVFGPEASVDDAFVMQALEEKDDPHSKLFNMVIVELLRVLLDEVVETAIIKFLAEDKQLRALAANAFGEDKLLR